ncbi:MAG: hypothetical protein AUK16_00065 [Parcubacteria group bacterium CG2_30_44_11]|nr:MAG: hypothetical protein AUK16_00065 [Parcubacteria group bacterium CG2_30_44_11]
MKTITLHVSGMHCPSCKILIEDILSEQSDIKNPQVDLKNEIITFKTSRVGTSTAFAIQLTDKTKNNGYSFSVEKPIKEKTSGGVIWQALPIGLAFLVLFFLLQKSDILNFSIGGTTTPVTGLVVGLIASVSSCLAIVGGLVLSLSATIVQDKVSDIKPMVLFHSGRILGFAFLGGILGAIGGAIGINFTLGAILGLLASLVMIMLGLNLVGLLKKSTITLPSGIFTWFRTLEQQTIAPFVLGVGTFFLPCGFTQAMQISALSSGSFISGMLIMGAFALGTLPMLALLSFGSASFSQSKHAPLFFTASGVVVIGLGIFALLTGLASLDIIDPLFTV